MKNKVIQCSNHRNIYILSDVFSLRYCLVIPVNVEFKNYVLNCMVVKLPDIFHVGTTRVLDHSDCSELSWPDFDPIALLQALVNAARIIHAWF